MHSQEPLADLAYQGQGVQSRLIQEPVSIVCIIKLTHNSDLYETRASEAENLSAEHSLCGGN
jgi:hypothetical protein